MNTLSRLSKSLIGATVLTLVITGCADMSQTQRGTATGAGIGAGLGALLGGTTGGERPQVIQAPGPPSLPGPA